MRRRSLLAAALAVACLPATARAQAAKADPIAPETVLLAADILIGRERDRARARRALGTDRRQLMTVRRAALPLIEYAPTFAPGCDGWQWAVDLETREEPLAYCLPGGKIMLSTALVERTRLTPPELAVAIAHAIAHALSGHDSAEALAQLARRPDPPDPNRRALLLADILAKLTLATPHDKATEQAVDTMTLEFMARAGVDPEPAAEAWRKIARAGGATPPGFLALHPMWPGRVEEIEAQLPAALPLYEQAKAAIATRGRVPPVRTRPGGN